MLSVVQLELVFNKLILNRKYCTTLSENVCREAVPIDSEKSTCSHSLETGHRLAENGLSADFLNSGLHSRLPLSPDRKHDTVGMTPNRNIPDVSSRLPASDDNEADTDETVLPGKDQTNHRLRCKAILVFFGVLIRLVLISEVGQRATQVGQNYRRCICHLVQFCLFGFEQHHQKKYNCVMGCSSGG